MKLKYLCRIFGLAVLLVLAGCDDDDSSSGEAPPPADDETPAPAPADPSPALIRLMHAVVDGPPLFPRIDDLVVAGAAYGQASSSFQFDDNDTRMVEVLYEGPAGEPLVLVDGISLPIGDDREVYVLVHGRFDDPQVAIIDNPAFVLPTDNDGNVIDQNAVDIQFVAGFFQYESVDVYLTDAAVDIATVNPTVTLARGDVSPQVEYSADFGWRVRVTPVGEKTVLFDTNSYNMLRARNSVYLLTDFFGTGDTNLILNRIGLGVNAVIGSITPPADLRIANFVANTPAVDLYFGDTDDAPEFDSVPYRTVTEYRSFQDQSVSINLTPEDDNLTFLHERELVMGVSQRLTLLVSGDAQGDTEGVVLVGDSRPIANAVQMDVAHAAPDAGDVDVYVLAAGESVDGNDPTIPDLEYPFFASAQVELGASSIVFTERGRSTVVHGPVAIEVQVGFPTVILTQPEGGGGALSTHILQDRTLE